MRARPGWSGRGECVWAGYGRAAVGGAWTGRPGATVPEHRLLAALCGANFRNSRDLAAVAGFPLLLWLGLTMVGLAARTFYLGAAGYLLAALPCFGCGGMAIASYAHWGAFIDVIEPAFWPGEET